MKIEEHRSVLRLTSKELKTIVDAQNILHDISYELSNMKDTTSEVVADGELVCAVDSMKDDCNHIYNRISYEE